MAPLSSAARARPSSTSVPRSSGASAPSPAAGRFSKAGSRIRSSAVCSTTREADARRAGASCLTNPSRVRSARLPQVRARRRVEQRARKRKDVPVSITGIFREAAREHPIDRRGKPRGDFGCAVRFQRRHPTECDSDVVVLEGVYSREHLVRKKREGVLICACVDEIAPSCGLLRRHVARGAEQHARRGQMTPRAHTLADSEVEEFDENRFVGIAGQKDVVGLEVPVDDGGSMGRG